MIKAGFEEFLLTERERMMGLSDRRSSNKIRRVTDDGEDESFKKKAKKATKKGVDLDKFAMNVKNKNLAAFLHDMAETVKFFEKLDPSLKIAVKELMDDDEDGKENTNHKQSGRGRSQKERLGSKELKSVNSSQKASFANSQNKENECARTPIKQIHGQINEAENEDHENSSSEAKNKPRSIARNSRKSVLAEVSTNKKEARNSSKPVTKRIIARKSTKTKVEEQNSARETSSLSSMNSKKSVSGHFSTSLAGGATSATSHSQDTTTYYVGYIAKFNHVKDISNVSNKISLLKADSLLVIQNKIRVLVVEGELKGSISILYAIMENIPIVGIDWVAECIKTKSIVDAIPFSIKINLNKSLFEKTKVYIYKERSSGNQTQKKSTQTSFSSTSASLSEAETDLLNSAITRFGGKRITYLNDADKVIILDQDIDRLTLLKNKKEITGIFADKVNKRWLVDCILEGEIKNCSNPLYCVHCK